MRKLTGRYDGADYVILEYQSGYVECSPGLGSVLANADLSLPTGEALEDACLVIFGDTLQVEEVE